MNNVRHQILLSLAVEVSRACPHIDATLIPQNLSKLQRLASTLLKRYDDEVSMGGQPPMWHSKTEYFEARAYELADEIDCLIMLPRCVMVVNGKEMELI